MSEHEAFHGLVNIFMKMSSRDIGMKKKKQTEKRNPCRFQLTTHDTKYTVIGVKINVHRRAKPIYIFKKSV